jgi:hypothetical protein
MFYQIRAVIHSAQFLHGQLIYIFHYLLKKSPPNRLTLFNAYYLHIKLPVMYYNVPITYCSRFNQMR